VDEGCQDRSVLPLDGAEGPTERKADTDDLSKFLDVKFQRSGRYLRRRGIAIIRKIEKVLNGPVVLVPHLPFHPGEPELGAVELLHGPEIPQVRPVKRHAERTILLPDKRTDQSVPQRDSFVPRSGKIPKDEIMPIGNLRLNRMIDAKANSDHQEGISQTHKTPLGKWNEPEEAAVISVTCDHQLSLDIFRQGDSLPCGFIKPAVD
jgi:hypothetical protein